MDAENPIKLFVSYSHLDTRFKDSLLVHLKPLTANGVYSIWHDADIQVGEDIDPIIKEQLEQYDVIIFLISPDFLASDYCQKVEATRAFERMVTSEAQIFPVVVRPCVWRDTTFAKYKCAPKDGNPVSEHDSEDKAWVNVIELLKSKRRAILVNRDKRNLPAPTLVDGPCPTPENLKYMKSTEVLFQNRHKEDILLEDIYIYPDLQSVSEDIEKHERITNAAIVFRNDENKILVTGEEQSGKTALAKMIYRNFLSNGKTPVYLTGKDLDSTDIERILKRRIPNQYIVDDVESFFRRAQSPIVIIDNFVETKLNNRFRKRILDILSTYFKKVILISDQSMMRSLDDRLVFEGYEHYEILPFGHVKRSELITKWSSLGQEETIGDSQLIAMVDESKRHIDLMLKKNIVPPKPIFILVILQTLETVKPSDFSLTSYGHCYQLLITQALVKAKIKNTDPHINFLTCLAFFIYQSGRATLDEIEFNSFIDQYSSQYILAPEVVGELVGSGIIDSAGDSYSFRYKYIFYFYAAKYIAEYLHISKVRELVTDLCKKIHIEKHANVLIFVTHHTKDPFIVDEIRLYSSTIFEKHEQADLGEESLDFLKELINDIPALVLETRDVEEERLKVLKEQDADESLEASSDDDDELEDESLMAAGEDSDNASPYDEILADINRSAKAVEIMGQILRNRSGSMKKDELSDLAADAYATGFRFLNFYFSMSEDHKAEILLKLAEEFRDRRGIGPADAERFARKFYLGMCYTLSLGVIKKIAYSVGTNSLAPIFKGLAIANDTPAYRLVELAIHLEFKKDLPRKEIAEMRKDFRSNIVCTRILQEIVIQHVYMHYLRHDDKQWISEVLGLPVGAQQQIDLKSKRKMHEK